MLQINIVARGLGGLMLIILGIATSLIAGILFAYAFDKNWRGRVNRFFLKFWITSIGRFFRLNHIPEVPNNRIAACTLGDPASENGAGGITLIDREGHNDGATVKEIIGNEFVRRTDNKNNKLYFYFAFSEEVVDNFRNKPIIILVEYLD